MNKSLFNNQSETIPWNKIDIFLLTYSGKGKRERERKLQSHLDQTYKERENKTKESNNYVLAPEEVAYVR